MLSKPFSEDHACRGENPCEPKEIGIAHSCRFRKVNITWGTSSKSWFSIGNHALKRPCDDSRHQILGPQKFCKLSYNYTSLVFFSSGYDRFGSWQKVLTLWGKHRTYFMSSAICWNEWVLGGGLGGLQDVMRVSLGSHDLTLIGCHIHAGMLLNVLDWWSVSMSFGFHFVDCRVKNGSFLLIPSQEG